jgi:hypothetical protein
VIAMLDELPGLAKRLKDFVRENPVKERSWSEDPQEQRFGIMARTGSLLTEAAAAGRESISWPVTNDALSLAEVRSYENRVNAAPLASMPGIGAGLVRVLLFKMGQDNPCLGKLSPGRLWAMLEYSPLGWPELPDMAEADLNVLFQETPSAVEIDPKDAALLKTSEHTPEQLRREWGFP